METYDQEITTAEDMVELVDDWLYGNVTMEEADEIVFDGAPTTTANGSRTTTTASAAIRWPSTRPARSGRSGIEHERDLH